MTTNLLKQAAPANVSTRDRLFGSGSRIDKRHNGTKHRVRQFAGAACLTPYWAFLALEEYHEIFQARSKAAPLQAPLNSSNSSARIGHTFRTPPCPHDLASHHHSLLPDRFFPKRVLGRKEPRHRYPAARQRELYLEICFPRFHLLCAEFTRRCRPISVRRTRELLGAGGFLAYRGDASRLEAPSKYRSSASGKREPLWNQAIAAKIW
jgi:hypothetical protein